MYLVETGAYEQASSHIALASGSGSCSLSTFEGRPLLNLITRGALPGRRQRTRPQ